MTKTKPYYITTAIDYVNNLPHIGTAYEKIGADVIARFKRFEGESVFFLMGNDEHSINVKKEALSRGLAPQDYCDQMAVRFKEIWKKLDISYDDFIRTTDERHQRAVTELFRRIHERGDIYRATYRGLYCDSCETFYMEKDLVDGKCPQHGSKPQWIEEENYFFALSRYGERIEKLIRDKSLRILPEIRENEILKVIEGGLEDISISRSSFDWGIPLPIEPGHVIYVWFDALINYISAIGFGTQDDRFSATWPADMHVIGKDITRFHCIIWPAMLLSAGLDLPRTVFGHGFVFLKGEKMSKTLGNVVTPMELVDVYGPDALRYYLLRDTSFGKDGNFTWDNFLERYNGDLANDLGNLLQRLLTMIMRYGEGKVPAPGELVEADLKLQEDCLDLYPQVRAFLDPDRRDVDFHLALMRIWETVRHANQYVDRSAPWELHKQGNGQRLGTVLYCAAECTRFVATVLYPFLPRTTLEILRQLGVARAHRDMACDALSQWGLLPPGTEVEKPSAVFPRIQEEKPKRKAKGEKQPPAQKKPKKKEHQGEDAAQCVPFKDFQALDLRVGTVLEAERVPDTDALLKLTVDIGEERTVVAGIARTYAPEDVKGRTVVIVANLKPSRIRGVLSEGMVLAAGEKDNLQLVTLEGNVPPGTKVK